MDDPVEGGQIASIVQRVQRLQEEKRTIEDDIKEVYAEARGNGYDVKVLRAVVKHLGKDENETAEFDAIFDLYLQAFQSGVAAVRNSVPSRAHTRDARETSYPERVSRPAETTIPAILPAAQSEAAAGARQEQGSAVCAVGVGEAVHPAQADQFVTPTGAEEGVSPPADPAPAVEAKKPASIFKAKTMADYRPNCRHPENCASYKLEHCSSCRGAVPDAAEPDADDLPASLLLKTGNQPSFGEQA